MRFRETWHLARGSLAGEINSTAEIENRESPAATATMVRSDAIGWAELGWAGINTTKGRMNYDEIIPAMLTVREPMSGFKVRMSW